MSRRAMVYTLVVSEIRGNNDSTNDAYRFFDVSLVAAVWTETFAMYFEVEPENKRFPSQSDGRYMRREIGLVCQSGVTLVWSYEGVESQQHTWAIVEGCAQRMHGIEQSKKGSVFQMVSQFLFECRSLETFQHRWTVF